MAYLPLADLPHPLCEVERAARERATEDSGYEIVYRSGFHGRPAGDPPTVGAVETLAAAEWYARRLIRVGQGRRLRAYAYRPYSEYGAGTYPADAPTDPEAEAFARAAEESRERSEALAESFAARQPYVHWR